jgi:hypothetical protein
LRRAAKVSSLEELSGIVGETIGQISPVAFEMQHSNQTAAEPQAA